MPTNKKDTNKSHRVVKTNHNNMSPEDCKTCERLRFMGALIALASALMALLPMMYSGVYRYIAAHSYEYMSNFAITAMIMCGFIVALLYFLLGLHVIRAGENNTRLIRGVYQFNVILTFCAIVAGILLFLPWPVPTFWLMMTHLATASYVQQGIAPMFIMTFVDMALIIGLLASISGITYTCLADKTSSKK